MPTVEEFANTSGCSTGGLHGLNQQIVALLLPVVGDDLVSCEDIVQIVGASTIPLLQPASIRALGRAAQEKGEKPRLVHAYRTVAQQFVLRQWFKTGRCGITSARTPGSSPHEKGIAIDIQNNAQWRTVLESHNWRWAGPNDPGHFTFIGDNVSTTILVEGVRSFQRLWNLHNPTDLIDEDGVFGDIETGPRLLRSPIEGFQ
jgi:hypothetical protein